MRLEKIKFNSDLAEASLDHAVHQFVDEFGRWPVALLCSGVGGECARNAREHATDLGLLVFVVPEPITLKPDTWAVVGDLGETIWSPGA